MQTADGTSQAATGRGWQHAVEFAHGVRPAKMSADNFDVQLEHVRYLDGQRATSDVVLLEKEAAEPPADLQSRHVWSECPDWEAAETANVTQPPYNARGDGQTDDTKALQSAIDEHEGVFLPKGKYCVSRSLQLRPNTKLIGFRHLSVIEAKQGDGGDFSNPDVPQPLVRSADDPRGTAALAYVGLGCEGNLPAIMLHWRTGRNSVVRSIYISSNRDYQLRPTRVSDHGGPRHRQTVHLEVGFPLTHGQFRDLAAARRKDRRERLPLRAARGGGDSRQGRRQEGRENMDALHHWASLISVSSIMPYLITPLTDTFLPRRATYLSRSGPTTT